MRSTVSLLPLLLLTVAAGCSGGATGMPVTNNKVDASVMDDPNADRDGDGYTPGQGDCGDHDTSVYPGATELCDGKDNNCDGVVDEPCDNDGDGYTPKDGDCNDGEPLVNPGAFEAPGNNVDDDCDGQVDEATSACDDKVGIDPKSFAGAMELCEPWLVKAQFIGGSDPTQRSILGKFGKFYKPKTGKTFIALSTGIAADSADTSYMDPQPGTEFANPDVQNPLPMNTKNNVCGKATSDELMVHDYVEMKISLKVPTNAKTLSFQFTFFSAEYPEWVGSDYNDKFLAVLDSQSYKGNVSFDKNKNPITVNVGFFDACDSALICDGKKTNTCTPGKVAELNGTGYELDDGDGRRQGGGTGWLTTTAPVTPGETATLRFVLFDEGDHILDSAVLIDNFQWGLTAAAGPTTIQ